MSLEFVLLNLQIASFLKYVETHAFYCGELCGIGDFGKLAPFLERMVVLYSLCVHNGLCGHIISHMRHVSKNNYDITVRAFIEVVCEFRGNSIHFRHRFFGTDRYASPDLHAGHGIEDEAVDASKIIGTTFEAAEQVSVCFSVGRDNATIRKYHFVRNDVIATKSSSGCEPTIATYICTKAY
jgi:hypothetical protein